MRGRGFPGWALAVTVPISTKAKPSASQAGGERARKSFTDTKLAEDRVPNRFFVVAAKQFIKHLQRLPQISREHFCCCLLVDGLERPVTSRRCPFEVNAMSRIDRQR